MAQLPDSAAAAWEALDVDDSDIRLGPPSTSRLPRPCSSTPTAHPHQDEPPHPSHHHRIPEPAAAAAQDMTRLRPATGSPPAALGRGDARAPDADFLLPPWLCALHFLGRDRAWEQPGIKAIKKEETLCRAPLVAGVVTSCKPNGLGDLLVTLKDPTETVAASVHKKVLLEGNNGQDISIGCVLVLRKVAVFRPTRKACYLNITKVTKVFQKDCDAPSKQVISSDTTERSEVSTNNIMKRLLGHERMMPSNNEMADIKVSLRHQGTSDSNNGTSTWDIYGRYSIGNNQEGGLEMLAGDQRRKSTLNCCTDGPPQQNFNIRNMTCSQPSLCGSRVMFGYRYSTQASDNENLSGPFDNAKVLHSSKKLKSDATLPDGYGETTNSRNMNTELDGMSEQFNGQDASIREPIEHQQRNFIAVDAGSEYATTTSGSLINPQKALPVASLGGWTDDQISELFADY
ncbi:hypothetical protein SETIT_2G100700v2 [Setaria italica]|uniref:Homologous recombination OB-fold protein OB-fold domain-containing protein n=2 Tax=Setaria italica TaxID=4555 RepID=A0A368PWX3_SETIT|nr:uncharacterized protein LOC101778315 isoform X1 [Setaria italica]RCV10291.1 hypothetical protein SETIT_2G100700v2 [Setaria italica]